MGHRLYDVNLRRNTMDKVAGYSEEIIRVSLELATVVKMNEAELEEVALMLNLRSAERDQDNRVWDLMETIQHDYDLTALALTRGALGARLLVMDTRLQLADSELPADCVHPVGGGDSFAAGLLFGIVRGWSLEDSLALADLLSRWVVTNVMAAPIFTSELLSQICSLVARCDVEAASREHPLQI
jgi:sugar/nucleoside kinase (ribokinase family)